MKILNVLIASSLVILMTSSVALAETCPRVTGIRQTKEYIRRKDSQCFGNVRTAERRGYLPFGTGPTPVPTMTPTATATPTNQDFTGTWTSVAPGLTRTTDSCTSGGFTSASAIDLSIQVTHYMDSNAVVGAETDGRRSWGPASTNDFSLIDTNIGSEACNPLVQTSIEFSAVAGSSATVTRTDTITCRAGAAFTCSRSWTGSAAR